MPKGTPLDTYREKRSAESTPEPFGGEAGGSGLRGGGLFVVQKHAARRTHYDLRLEMQGVLKSWAVPKGFSLDPKEKRFAAETEDHPFEYHGFEGIIPEGNYGAGAMIVWDRGVWIPLEDPVEGHHNGKLLFELRGYKLRGVWTMFRIKPSAIHRAKDDGKSWLLMKKPDAAAGEDAGDTELGTFPETSVLSGLTVEELASGAERIDALAEDVATCGAPKRRVDLDTLKPMLAQIGQTPFSRKGWLYELKYDGYRLLAATDSHQARLRYRNGHDASALYPELAKALGSWPVESLVLDGEVVVLRADGRPSFGRLQKRAMLSRTVDISRAALEHPAAYFAFDLLSFNGFDLRPLPLAERKAFLARLMPRAGPLRYLDHIEERGELLFRHIESMHLEGMVAKDAASRYVGRRSGDWIKYRVERTGDFAIVGMTLPKDKGTRSGFGALHVAVWEEPAADDGDSGDLEPGLVYAGRVGTGFDQRALEELSQRLLQTRRATPPCRGEVPRGERHVWVEPTLVAEVRYKEITAQHMLRHPVFLRLRDDKTIQDTRVQRPVEDIVAVPGDTAPGDLEDLGDEPPVPHVEAVERKLVFSNQDKIFWPEAGYTKGDLIEYYRAVSGAMLPLLENRPIVLTRYPDGIHGKSFFQKNAPDFAPDWIKTETIYSDGSERDIEYFVVNDQDTLLYLANLGAVVLHVWSSRLATLAEPDWCILDLDPKDAPFTDVVKIALEIKLLCDDIGLASYVKTSGSSGLHLLVPLGRRFDYEQSRTLGQLIANIVAQKLPDIATTVRNPAKRDGKVYIDYVQNGHGRLLVAPFSARVTVAGSVSTPLHWREVDSKLTIEQFTLETVPKRLARQKKDPFEGLLEAEPDLLGALGRLSSRM